MARKHSPQRNSSNPSTSEQCTKPGAPPTKNSAGAGFPFETEVAAACLLDLLLEQSLDGRPLSRLDVVGTQKRPAHWLCDDVLLIYATDDGDQILVPSSVKSFPVLSTVSERSEFVAHSWRDVLMEHGRPRPFRLGH